MKINTSMLALKCLRMRSSLSHSSSFETQLNPLLVLKCINAILFWIRKMQKKSQSEKKKCVPGNGSRFFRKHFHMPVVSFNAQLVNAGPPVFLTEASAPAAGALARWAARSLVPQNLSFWQQPLCVDTLTDGGPSNREVAKEWSEGLDISLKT